jgi:biotin carboxyl carrier protein
MKLSGTIADEQMSAESTSVTLVESADDRYVFSINGASQEVFLSESGASDGNMLSNVAISIESERERIIRERFKLQQVGGSTKSSSSKIVKAPMPGMVKSILVDVGTPVMKNTAIIILEAMKMENSIAAGVDGVVKSILTQTGSSIDKNAPICEIE